MARAPAALLRLVRRAIGANCPGARRRACLTLTRCGSRRSCFSKRQSRRWKPYYEAFLARWPTINSCGGGASRGGDASLGRARLLCACPQSPCLRRRRRRVVTAALSALARRNSWPCRASVPYTAAAIAAIAFGQRAVVIDGNVERVVARLYAIGEADAGGQVAHPCRRRKPDAGRALRRFRPGHDGHRGDDLYAETAGLRPLSAGRVLPRARHGGPRRLSGQAAEGGAAIAHRRRFLYPPRRRPRPGAHARSPRPSRRHDRNPWHRLDRTKAAVRRRHAAAAAGTPKSPARPGQPCVHPFRAGPSVHLGEAPAGADAPPGFRFVSPMALDAEALPSLMRKVVAHVRALAEVNHPRTDRDRTSSASPHRHRKHRKRPAPTAPS